MGELKGTQPGRDIFASGFKAGRTQGAVDEKTRQAEQNLYESLLSALIACDTLIKDKSLTLNTTEHVLAGRLVECYNIVLKMREDKEVGGKAGE